MLNIFARKRVIQKSSLDANRLSKEVVAQVAGGRMLNPQPLPPWSGR